MSRSIALTAVVIGLLACAAHAVPPGYALHFEDNFNGDAVDGDAWRVAEAEKQPKNRDGMDVPASVSVQDGNLVIRAFTEDGEHRTGRVVSLTKYGPGCYEARIKFNTSPGMWSAFWLFTQSIYAEGGGKVDPHNEGVARQATRPLKLTTFGTTN